MYKSRSSVMRDACIGVKCATIIHLRKHIFAYIHVLDRCYLGALRIIHNSTGGSRVVLVCFSNRLP